MKELIDLISKKEVQQYIRSHHLEDVQKLLLKEKVILGVPTGQIATQISGRRKAQDKLPLWYKTERIIYPPSMNLEQCSSEATARFKLSLLRELFKEPPVIADLTGGFGVDTYFLSQHAQKVHYAEPDNDLLEIARHNHSVLGTSNITHHNQSAETFLTSIKEFPDLLFIDPSRRKGSMKVFKLADCEPDVIALQSKSFTNAKHILVKTSPLLDLQQGNKELVHAKTIFVVAVENECKELLFHIQQGFEGEPSIHAVDLDRNGKPLNECALTFSEEKRSIVRFSPLQRFLYEPYASILKAGAFKWVAQKFGVSKLAPNTHLYTADQLIDNFPGRIFKILHQIKPDKNSIKFFSGGFANIISRNFPLTVEEVKKKTGLKEGGDLYLICTQSESKKFVMVAERLK